jgi:XapX domain-containing protein
MKILLGFLVAFSIGAICRVVGIPSPAPNALLGSLLVVSMSLGYVTADRYLPRSKSTIITQAHSDQSPTPIAQQTAG